jgi:hypothetical protein
MYNIISDWHVFYVSMCVCDFILGCSLILIDFTVIRCYDTLGFVFLSGSGALVPIPRNQAAFGGFRISESTGPVQAGSFPSLFFTD